MLVQSWQQSKTLLQFSAFFGRDDNRDEHGLCDEDDPGLDLFCLLRFGLMSFWTRRYKIFFEIVNFAGNLHGRFEHHASFELLKTNSINLCFQTEVVRL